MIPIAFAAALAAASCGEGSTRIPWLIKFANPSTAGETTVVVAAIYAGGCPGTGAAELVYQEQIVLDAEESVLRPPKLEPGTYGFAGLARNLVCERIADGCVEVTLPLEGEPDAGAAPDGAADGGNGPGELDGGGAGPGAGGAGSDTDTVCVVLADRAPSPECAPAECTGGVCPSLDGGPRLDGAVRDAATDAPADAGRDAPPDGSRPDTGLMCPAGFGECDGDPAEPCETPLDDLSHCGACSTPCAIPHASETCESRVCRFVECEAGWDNCDVDETDNGCETNVLTDPLNCGACGGNPPCLRNHRLFGCISGACDFEMPLECEPGWADCVPDEGGGGDPGDGGTEDGGMSDGGMSDGGIADAGADDGTDGCETQLGTPENCLGCGDTCMLDNVLVHGCEESGCTIVACALGFADCDGLASTGCEADIANDPTRCGDCDTDCTNHATASCSGGACMIVACDASWGDCDADPTTGCEVDLSADMNNCGTCGRMCDGSRTCCIRSGETSANCHPSGLCS